MDSWMKDVTSRLQRIESFCCGSGAPPPAVAPVAPAPGVAVVVDVAKPKSVEAWKELLDGPVATLQKHGAEMGGRGAELSAVVVEAFKKEGDIVEAIAACKPASAEEMQKYIEPVGELIQKASAMDKGKLDSLFNHCKAVSESMMALSWVCYQPGVGMSMPAAHVGEAWDSAEFYANKIIMEFRGKDEVQVKWIKTLKEIYSSLKAYVKEYHTTGPQWNKNGMSIADFKPSGGGGGGGGGAAKPPAGSDGLLSALNAGGSVTSGLKKVTDDMKTKNRAERSGAVPGSKPKTASVSSTPAAAAPKKAPVLQLKDNMWAVEYHENVEAPIEIKDTSKSQKVYIFKCKNATIVVSGKVNAITMDNCQKCNLVFGSVLSTVEIINSKSAQVQVNDSCPTFNVDKTDGCQIYLNRESMGADIITAKSSEMNVLMPGATDDDDFIETPIPEQFITKFDTNQKKWITEVSSHSGG